MEGQLTLTELNMLVKEALQVSFPEQVWVVAEIGEMKVNRSGHCYLELVDKDDDSEEITARTRATIWSWQFRFIQPYFETTTGRPFSSGLKVLISATVEFHEVYGYSLNIKDIDPTYTLGDLARRRMEIIKRLNDEGVFDMNREIPIPDIPSRIAIISSPTAAGYEDFINQLLNNQAGYHFYTRLFPAVMQGSEAVPSIIDALDTIYEAENFYDVVVIIRGGGSQLDLSCFDDYELALHIAQFPLPVLTGIGHEKDESIADMVANTRLKTPTAVAEFLIGRFNDAATEIEELENAFFDSVTAILTEENQHLDQAMKMLKPLVNARIQRSFMLLERLVNNTKTQVRDELSRQQFSVEKLGDRLRTESNIFLKLKSNELSSVLAKTTLRSKFGLMSGKQMLDEKVRRLNLSTKQMVEKRAEQLKLLERTKQLVDPKNILDRGFSITMKDGKAIKSVEDVTAGNLLETILSNGKIESVVQTFPGLSSKEKKN